MPLHFDPAIVINVALYTLLAFSLITWTLILFKIWQFAKNSFYNHQYNKAFWDSTNLQAAQQLPVEKARGPNARIAACGFNWIAEMSNQTSSSCLKFSGCPRNLLERTLRKQIQDEQQRIEGGLTMLASIGSTAPFVGLFGTVLGIMHAMHDISEKGSASLDVVAGPIGDALIATAIGIVVAVPAVLAYNFFVRRAKHHRASLESFVEGYLLIALANEIDNAVLSTQNN